MSPAEIIGLVIGVLRAVKLFQEIVAGFRKR